VVWLFIHVAFLTGYRNRLSAVFTWWLAFTRDLRRERTFTIRDVATVHDLYGTSMQSITSAQASDLPPAPDLPPASDAPPASAPATSTPQKQ
jgi:hypothetical protein